MKAKLASVAIGVAGACCLSASAGGQKVVADYDPLADFLRSKGFANIPYIKQNQAKLGGVVADPISPGLPIFEVPSKAVPAADPNPGILIPGELVGEIQAAGLGLKFLGFDSSADFQDPKALSYNSINLTGPQLNIDQVRDLLKDPATVAKLNAYKGGISRGAQNFRADLYLASAVFYSTGVDIVSKTGREVSLKSNASIPACAATPLPGAPGGGVKNGQSDQGQDSHLQGASGSTSGGADTATSAPAGSSAGGGGSAGRSGSAGESGSSGGSGSGAAGGSGNASGGAGAGGSAATAGAGQGAANAVANAAEKGIPGGSGHYCRGVNGEVHFTSDRPIPIAMELYYASWDGQGYTPTSPNQTPLFKAN